MPHWHIASLNIDPVNDNVDLPNKKQVNCCAPENAQIFGEYSEYCFLIRRLTCRSSLYTTKHSRACLPPRHSHFQASQHPIKPPRAGHTGPITRSRSLCTHSHDNDEALLPTVRHAPGGAHLGRRLPRVRLLRQDVPHRRDHRAADRRRRVHEQLRRRPGAHPVAFP